MLAPAKIGIVGTGFIGLGLAVALESMKTLTLSAILTRRDTGSIDSRHRDKLTTSLNRLIDQSDLIVECTGDAIYATEIVDRVLSAGRPIVTMNSEFHVTTGSYFTDRGVLTESQGDQPGSIAALAEQAREMGLEPVVYGNRKGFYNPDPTLEQMQYWAAAQGISLRQVTSFTDGTKIQIEAALVANGLGARIAQNGLLALERPMTSNPEGWSLRVTPNAWVRPSPTMC